MSKFARIVDGRIVEVVDQKAYETFHAAVQAMFVSCPADVRPGYTRDKEEWVAPSSPAPPEKKGT